MMSEVRIFHGPLLKTPVKRGFSFVALIFPQSYSYRFPLFLHEATRHDKGQTRENINTIAYADSILSQQNCATLGQ